MTYETILYDAADGVATITLNRPDKINAFNNQMIAETIRAFKAAGRDGDVRCVVLTAVGRGFSSGQDLSEFLDRSEDATIGEHLRQGYHQLIRQMVTLEKPIIGAINGIVAGAGFGVALATDIRIASHDAYFMLAFSRIGLIPDSGLNWFLPRIVGYSRAYEMAVTADRIPADQALEWGLVNRVVPLDQLPEITAAWARRLASGPTLAHGLTKRAMNRGWDQSLEEALEYEVWLQEVAARSGDNREGITAFFEKREARFTGS